ncbi:MAG: hypothetical protein RL217_1220 [Pseudomonadota bacterium]|jgi:TonB family protein
MWIKKLLASLALLSVLLTAPSQAADLELNGVAVYSYLTREYYLGGLYLPKRSDDPKYIRSDAINKRMQLVVRVSSWSPRRWTDIWQNNLAINNDDLDPSPQMQDALIKFTGFLRSDLKQGDQLDVLYQANGNSRVLLNGDLVLEVAGVDFFNYMVNTWIGKLPPTREFRQQILGQETTNEQFRAALLGHKAARPGLYAGWMNAEKSAAQAAARAADAEREQARQARLEQQRQQELAKSRSEDRQQEEEEEERQTRLAAEKLAKERAEQQKKQQELAVKTQAEKLAREGNQNAAKTLADEQRYYLQMLQWQIQRQVESTVAYPAWAKQFNQEGLVELDFHINRRQELSKIQVRNDSISNLLTNEVQRAANAAVSKVTLPPQLAGDSWPVSVRYQFSLKGSTQNDTAMPTTPSSLAKAGGNEELKQQDYRNNQSARILSQVQYPPGARVLKKQDKVKIEVSINAEGSVTAVREVQASKHREFNQAMQAAVKAAEPFPPLPVGLKTITFSIEHEFKL